VLEHAVRSAKLNKAVDSVVSNRLSDVSGTLKLSAPPSVSDFRRRERAMQRFRSAKTLQKFSSVHAPVHNHFNQERHLVTREIYKQRRSAALAEWRTVMA
jgi:transposase-like protein